MFVPDAHEFMLVSFIFLAATGVFVLPAMPWLQALVLKKDEMAQALGLSFTVSTLALAVTLASSRHLNAGSLRQSLLMLLPALLGMWLGQRLRDEMSQESFRAWLMWGLLALGLWLICFGLEVKSGRKTCLTVAISYQHHSKSRNKGVAPAVAGNCHPAAVCPTCLGQCPPKVGRSDERRTS